MNPVWMPVAILIPVLGGALVPVLPFRKRIHMEIYLETLMTVTSLLVWGLIVRGPAGAVPVVKFVNNLSLSFRLDGCGMVFSGLVSALWPLAALYSFEYMKKERHEKVFFMFFTMTYGVTLGISFAEDLLTMYFFYELLTLSTVPLVLHTLTREAILAARKYLYYSLGGAAFAFIGLVFLMLYGTTLNFTYGGVLSEGLTGEQTVPLLLIYVIAFMGFGVKAAVCPFNSWLPQAGVAPTPVTALLHAVAVVKAGAFAIIRLTWYCYGVDFLRGTWAQQAVMAVTVFTIVYGCSRALKETHIKRRLAWSTVSNLSYILFGVTVMTPLGLVGALAHMVFHAVMKICSFFCAGAVMYRTEKHYVHELNGLGRRMPAVFAAFTVSALALMGVPGLCGFVSKWYLANAAVMSGQPLALAGIAALLVSALLTAIYMFSIVVRAFFVPEDAGEPAAAGAAEAGHAGTASAVPESVGAAPAGNVPAEGGAAAGVLPAVAAAAPERLDPNWLMLLPLLVFVVFMILFGLGSDSIVGLFTDISNGVI